jgi:nitrate/nitrite transporter NarK
VVGIGGRAGSLAGMAFAQVISRILQFTNNNYFVPFAYASLVYLAAVGIMHWLVPRLEAMTLESRAPEDTR